MTLIDPHVDRVVTRVNLRLAAQSAERLRIDVDLDAEVPCQVKRCTATATVILRTRCCRRAGTFCTEHVLAIVASIERANQDPEIDWFVCFCGFHMRSPSTFAQQFVTESIR